MVIQITQTDNTLQSVRLAERSGGLPAIAASNVFPATCGCSNRKAIRPVRNESSTQPQSRHSNSAFFTALGR